MTTSSASLQAARDIADLELHIVRSRGLTGAERASLFERWEALHLHTTDLHLAQARSERAARLREEAVKQGREYFEESPVWASVVNGGLPTLGRRR